MIIEKKVKILEHRAQLTSLVPPKRDQYNVLVRARGAQEELLKSLMEMPEVSKAHPDGNFIFVAINGGEEESCGLLAGLVKQGHRIVEFYSPKKRS